MDKLFKVMASLILVITAVAFLAFPFMPAFASTPEAFEGQGGNNNGGRQVTSLDISKDIGSVTAPDSRITPEKTASESNISMEVGDEHDASFTFNDAQTEVAAEVITPADEGQISQQTLPVTGSELTYLLILVGAAVLPGTALASFGLARLTR